MERWIKSFSDIPLGQRLILLVAAAASVATIVVAVLWAQRPNLEPLFGNLSTEDAGAIVDRLRDQHVLVFRARAYPDGAYILAVYHQRQATANCREFAVRSQ